MKKTKLLRVGAALTIAASTGYAAYLRGTAPEETANAPVAAQLAQVPSAAIAPPAPALQQPAAKPAPLREIERASAELPAAAPPTRAPSLPASPKPLAGTTPTPEPAATQAPLLAEATPDCTADLALMARPGAMLDLGLIAPCHLEERVVIRHGDLVVTGLTSSAGTLVTQIPALTADGETTIIFPNGARVVARTTVSDLGDYDRFAVQWADKDTFQLHAISADASLDSPGHISAKAPGVAGAEGGFLTIVGDARAPYPLLAEVYTWPAKTSGLDSKIALHLEASVTPETCGRELLGETIQSLGGRSLKRDLSIETPDCGAVGEYVSLQNLLAPEKIAAN